MKNTVKSSGMFVIFSQLLVACLASSCSLLNEPACPEPPYFPFTATDKQWQSLAANAQWVFENQRHQRRTYKVSQASYEEKIAESIAHPAIKIIYYHDYWGVSWERVDSAAQAGYFLLRRTPLQKDRSQSALVGEVQWKDFIGYHNDMGGFYPSYLDFGPDLAVLSFHELVVRGVKYQRVTNFCATSIAISRLAQFNAKQKTYSVDYDQRAGIIRFMTLNGDVWERLP